MTIFYILLAILAAALLYGISIYNNLVRNKNLVDEGWSGIETQLKRRANLIPNLIETVKGYATHERTAFEEVTKLRTQAMSTTDIGERGQKEGELTAALGRLFAVAEAYPDLKASQNFIDLQDDLSGIENEIQLSRRYYNGTVRNMNILVESFPSNIIAKTFSFITAKFFEIDNADDRAVPEVSFGS
ncbi:MAG: LemA family protein [Gammaproteobacteria bacterium]|nr:MAG: LemA family protein [Gammaproteobacteria bacterium]